ncbi:MAG TPA: hypothetical protein VIJ61_01455, partial [Thermoanaerobaculia bacterium]
MRCAPILAILLALPAAGQGSGPPTVGAGLAAGRIVLDGVLNEPAWAAAGVIPELTQQDPKPGEPTPFSTRVAVLADG